jgi:signal transduction histidine kinase
MRHVPFFSEQACPHNQNESNEEAEAMLALIREILGDLSQPITVVTGLSHLLLSEVDQNSPMTKDLSSILKQTERMKETLESMKYITDYDRPIKANWRSLN